MIFETEYFDILGPVLIKPRIFADDRGYFFESFSKRDFEKAGIDCEFVQDNQSFSSKGTLRGLHFQYPPHAQSKLVRVSYGRVLDIAVDIRPDSSTYGKYIAVELNDQNHHLFFIPQGFAHGYLVLSDHAVFLYKCDQYYQPTAEGGIKYNDPGINIKWPQLGTGFIISAKDNSLPYLTN
jgi:dTDP-4-dehydrorhamnose 3,5-epimerase